MQDATFTALTIAGSDNSGGAGIQADLKTFSAIGVHGTCVITSITAQNTKKVWDIFELPENLINQQFDTIFDDFKIEFAKCGMLYSKNVIELILKKIESNKIKLVLDPIIFASSGARLLKEDAEKSLVELLFPKSYLITPNLIEARKITGETIENIWSLTSHCLGSWSPSLAVTRTRQ